MGLEIYISLDRIDHHIYNPFEMAIYKSWTVGETKIGQNLVLYLLDRASLGVFTKKLELNSYIM